MPKHYQRYLERLNIVKSYIETHLDEDLSLEKLAQIAFMSPYHFHRIYRVTHGETIINSIRRLRMQRAAELLNETDISIIKIAQKCGYTNPQSFTRLFKAMYGISPTYFRTNIVPKKTPVFSKKPYPIEIKTIDHFKTVFVAHSGTRLELTHAYERLFDWLNINKHELKNFQKIRVVLDNPYTTPNHMVRTRACVASNERLSIKAPLETMNILGGNYAVVQHAGHYEKLEGLYKWFFASWLPETKFMLGNAPIFEKYLNNCHITPADNLLTEVYFPLQIRH